jgi:chromosome segregation ATPase
MMKKDDSLAKILDELKIIKSEMREAKSDRRTLELRIRGLKDSLDDESALIKEQNLEFKDEILGEIKAMREELVATLSQYGRHEDILDNHEKRIEKVEKTVFPQ